jgi:hypothetical protein
MPTMMTITEIAGFAGAGLTGAAYVPQISHLIKAARPGREAAAQAFRSWPKSPIAAASPFAAVAGPGTNRPRTGFQTTHPKGTK